MTVNPKVATKNNTNVRPCRPVNWATNTEFTYLQ